MTVGQCSEGHMLDEHEQRERLLIMNNALSNQRLAGLEVDAETVADMQRYVRGEIDLATARQRVLDRISARNLRNRATW